MSPSLVLCRTPAGHWAAKQVRHLWTGRVRGPASSLASTPLTYAGHNARSLSSSSSSSPAPPSVVFVLGGPGAGKGTQCRRISRAFDYVHLPAGELLRQERQTPGSEFGELIERHLVDGTIVPVAITCSLLERAMLRDDTASPRRFLIDGFPRNRDNLSGWERQMSAKVDLKSVLFLRCSSDTSLRRCLERGAVGSGRSDDNEQSLRKRLDTYKKVTMPIVEHYRQLGLLVEIDADETEDEVFELVRKLFEAE